MGPGEKWPVTGKLLVQTSIWNDSATAIRVLLSKAVKLLGGYMYCCGYIWQIYICWETSQMPIPLFTSLSCCCCCCTVAPPSILDSGCAFVIHSRQRVFWFTFAWEGRSTRLDWCPRGEICLRLQTAFAPAKDFKQGAMPQENWCNAIQCKTKHTRDFLSQIPDELLDSVCIVLVFLDKTIIPFSFPAASVCSRQP